MHHSCAGAPGSAAGAAGPARPSQSHLQLQGKRLAGAASAAAACGRFLPSYVLFACQAPVLSSSSQSSNPKQRLCKRHFICQISTGFRLLKSHSSKGSYDRINHGPEPFGRSATAPCSPESPRQGGRTKAHPRPKVAPPCAGPLDTEHILKAAGMQLVVTSSAMESTGVHSAPDPFAPQQPAPLPRSARSTPEVSGGAKSSVADGYRKSRHKLP